MVLLGYVVLSSVAEANLTLDSIYRIVGGVVYRFSTSHEDSVATTPIAPSLNGFNGGYTSDPFAQATTIHSTAAASLPTRPPTPVSSVPHSSSTSRLIR